MRLLSCDSATFALCVAIVAWVIVLIVLFYAAGFVTIKELIKWVF